MVLGFNPEVQPGQRVVYRAFVKELTSVGGGKPDTSTSPRHLRPQRVWIPASPIAQTLSGTLPPSSSTFQLPRLRLGNWEVGEPEKKESCLPIALVLHLALP